MRSAGVSSLAGVSGPRGTAFAGSRAVGGVGAYGAGGFHSWRRRRDTGRGGFNAHGGYHNGWAHGYWNGNYAGGWGWNNGWGMGRASGLRARALDWATVPGLAGGSRPGASARRSTAWAICPITTPIGVSQPDDGLSLPIIAEVIDVSAPPPSREEAARPARSRNSDAAREAFHQGDFASCTQQTDGAIKQLPNDPAIHEFRARVASFAAFGRYEEGRGEASTPFSPVGPGLGLVNSEAKPLFRRRRLHSPASSPRGLLRRAPRLRSGQIRAGVSLPDPGPQ